MTTEGQPFWSTFVDLQQLSQPKTADGIFAREEALDTVLHDIVQDPTIPAEKIRQRFKSLTRNRRTKYFDRLSLDRERARPCYGRGGSHFETITLAPRAPDVSDAIANAQLMTLVRSVLPEGDFRLLWDLAVGATYPEIAVKLGVTIAAAKARIFRIRERVRKSWVAPTLRTAL
jgi:hypothetical protein